MFWHVLTLWGRTDCSDSARAKQLTSWVRGLKPTKFCQNRWLCDMTQAAQMPTGTIRRFPQKIGAPPNHPYFNRIFPHKSSILWYLHLWNPQYHPMSTLDHHQTWLQQLAIHHVHVSREPQMIPNMFYWNNRFNRTTICRWSSPLWCEYSQKHWESYPEIWKCIGSWDEFHLKCRGAAEHNVWKLCPALLSESIGINSIQPGRSLRRYPLSLTLPSYRRQNLTKPK